MPIITGDNGETVVQFGDGDVLISTAKQWGADFDNEVALIRDEPKEIGESTQKHVGRLTNYTDCPVRLQFTKSASVGVLIERLEKVKSQMEQAGC